MDLPDAIYAEVTRRSEIGNSHADHEEYDFAIREWEEALQLLPSPAEQWEAATWLYASIGDAHWQAGRVAATQDAMTKALSCPGAVDNPFIYFRLGQALRRQSQLDAAADALMRAYLLAGADIFHDDQNGEADLAFIKSQIREQ